MSPLRPRIIRPWFPVFALVFAALAIAFGGPVAIGTLWVWVLIGAVDAGWGLVTALQVTVLYRVRPGNYTAGDPLEVELQLANDGWLYAPAVTVRDGPACALAFGTGARQERYSLAPLSRLELRRSLPARRGQYRLGPLEIGAEGPFGLWSWTRELFSEREITVLPRLHPLPHWPLEQAEAYGRAAAGHSPYADPTLVVSTRPMLPGDSPRRIHWKRTAHTGALQVREVEPASGGQGIVVLDLWANAYGHGRDGQSLDAAAEMAAAVGHAILRSGAELSFLGTGKVPLRLDRRRGPRALGELLDTLAAAVADGARPLRDRIPEIAAVTPSRAVVVLVTGTHPAAWATGLPAIQARGATCAAVLAVPPGTRGDALPAAVGDLQRMRCHAWAAASAAALAEQLAGPRWRISG